MKNKFRKVIATTISKEQSEFVPQRSIVEGIIIAHEVINSIKKANTERILIKLDMRKAYDQVDKNFLLQILDHFGFGKEWIS